MLKLHPSAAFRWMYCPGSAALEAQYPKRPRDVVMDEGVAAHWAPERVLMSWKTGENRQLRDFLNSPCPENGVIITEEMVWGGMQYLEHIWETVHGYIGGLQIEKQLSIDKLIKGMNGRSDAIWHNEEGTLLVVWDLKFGFKAVSPVENWQLIIYALGAMTDATQAIEFVIVQPRGANASEPVKTWLITRDELLALADRLIEGARLARESAFLKTGPYCKKCRHAARCPVLREAGFEVLDITGEAMTVDIDENQIAYELELLDRAKAAVEARWDAMEALGVSRIKTGQTIPGFSYSMGKANRRWTKSAGDMNALGLVLGVDLMDHKPCTPAQAQVRGVNRETIDLYTERPATAAKLKRIDTNKTREVFQK